MVSLIIVEKNITANIFGPQVPVLFLFVESGALLYSTIVSASTSASNASTSASSASTSDSSASTSVSSASTSASSANTSASSASASVSSASTSASSANTSASSDNTGFENQLFLLCETSKSKNVAASSFF